MAGGIRPHSRAGWLPADATNFVGRRQETTRIKQLLTVARLVTLTGVGGAGKTRLALRVAKEVRRSYPDGAWLVDLATIPEQKLVGYAVAEALGIPDESGADPSELVIDHLRDRELLLVMDNCEHVLDGCAAFIDLMLRWAEGLRVMCTSRQPLNMIGEHIWQVAPLPVPQAGCLQPPVTGLRYPSVALFAERAAAAAPDFTLTPDNQDQVAEICRQLDGLPLAIELAAAQLRNLSVDQLATVLKDRLPALQTRYSLPAHHRTLEATFDWSFELCSPEEQRLWAQLSVFAGGFDLDAAEYVCAEGGPLLTAISGLVDKSVLLREEAAGEARYRLLETIRQYGLCRLRGGDGEEALVLRQRHRQWYVELAERLDADWFGPRQEQWSSRLRRERANVRSALEFCLANGDGERALRIAASLRFYWLGCGGMQEGQHWLDRVLAASTQPSTARALALTARAGVLNVAGERPGAAASAREALSLATTLRQPSLVARAMADLGICEFMIGEDLAKAKGLLEEALERLGDEQPAIVAIARLALAMTVLYQGDAERAVQICQSCLDLCRRHGERWCLATTLITSAIIDLRCGRLESAAVSLHESLATTRGLSDSANVTRALDLLAIVAVGAGQHERAARLLGAAWSAAGHTTIGAKQFRRRREEIREQVRAALGAEAFDAAHAEGASMSVEDAIAYARGEPERAGCDAPIVTEPPGTRLTRRELQVAELVAQGLSNKQMAARLLLAQRTVESHVENILRKLNFASRVQIAAWYVERYPPAPGPDRQRTGRP